jgi:hypothetical protein
MTVRKLLPFLLSVARRHSAAGGAAGPFWYFFGRRVGREGQTMKLAVFGSRTLKDDRVKMLIYDELEKTGADTIVTTQEPLGVCTVAQQVAKEIPIVLELHFLNFKYRTGAYEHRSDDVIKAADRVLLIHDGVSQGTKNELERVKHFGKPFRYEVLEATDTELQRQYDRKLEAFAGKEKEEEEDVFDIDL